MESGLSMLDIPVRPATDHDLQGHDTHRARDCDFLFGQSICLGSLDVMGLDLVHMGLNVGPDHQNRNHNATCR